MELISASCFFPFFYSSGKHLKILNLGDGQGPSGVTAVLQSTDDDAVDPHLERIKNQAGDEESDEEVLPAFNLCSDLSILSWIGIPSFMCMYILL